MRLLPLLPFAMLAACGANPPAADAPGPPAANPPIASHAAHGADGLEGMEGPDSVEYAVYSAILRTSVPRDESFFLVMDSTYALQLDLVARAALEESFAELAPDVQGLFGQLAYVGDRPFPLRPAFSLDDKYRLMSEAEFRGFFGLGPGDAWESHRVDGWAAIAGRFPGASGRYEFSRVAFDPDRRTALVFYRQRCGNACENAHYVVLQRRGDEWKVGHSIGVWSHGDDHTYRTHDHLPRDTVGLPVHGEPLPLEGPRPVRADSVGPARVP
jgi:hypothetical protein